ncbi:EscU/YscU/HrcU family type III secretion system export apparatus switch protein [Erythrobacter sp. LQ02-29]|uniref:EscU/YscU/HrcU family type III secretion system export apparatus switch protein n=1 Tax=Erythrobacter sp. LQ02-29 TaxID=2920384 RepID=UPI001F4EB43C|nr:EscU/YscU/HrcU family type III secretion system export apparatus switch protein [Erythrobacter sp. LQ02-29]MCP9221242.1 EscU/YscU/HrcU family type III secretion system export apparatus switch protein [Erythrobacter sp. LQ02-29]
MSDQAGEKTFAPTEKRRRDAAQKGDVLRSKEVGTAVSVMVGAVWLIVAGPWLFGAMEEGARSSFSFDRAQLADFTPGDLMLDLLMSMLPPVLAFGGCIMLATLVSQLLLGEGRFLAGNLKPKGSRINPGSGLKRMFGMQGLIELGKSLLKILLLGSIAWFWGGAHVMEVLSLGRGDLVGQLSTAWDAIARLLLLLAVGLVLIAFIDWPIQWIRRMGRLKMTHQEMRDEHKQSEGSPEKKAAIRQRQRQLARGGVANAVKDAQFILTNPSHFSVAMTYDPALAAAPVVLAKGRGEKALAMRELAAEHGVPVMEYPALARSVYFTTRENQMVREELYAAIASVLAFVMSLKRGDRVSRPTITVPSALRFDAEGRPQAA